MWSEVAKTYAIRMAGSDRLVSKAGSLLVGRLGAAIPRFGELRRQFSAGIDEIQVRSKLWLIDELASRADLDGATLIVLGAWYGILPLLVNWLLKPPARMICVDISADACALGQQVIGPLYPNIEYRVAGAMDLDYADLARDPSSVLINTICEHLPDIVTCPDHVNTVQDLDEMKAQTPMSQLLYAGVLRLPIFDRFMLIGYR